MHVLGTVRRGRPRTYFFLPRFAVFLAPFLAGFFGFLAFLTAMMSSFGWTVLWRTLVTYILLRNLFSCRMRSACIHVITLAVCGVVATSRRSDSCNCQRVRRHSIRVPL